MNQQEEWTREGEAHAFENFDDADRLHRTADSGQRRLIAGIFEQLQAEREQSEGEAGAQRARLIPRATFN